MVTMAGTQKNLGHLLNSLIELDYDAVSAYEAAIERLDNPQYRAQLTEFLTDHQRHIVELRPIAGRYADKVAQGPDLKQVLTTGKVMLAGMVGDKAILMAMKTNENDTNTAYERACQHRDAPAEVLTVLQRNLADEQRHRAWLETTLSNLRRDQDTLEDTESQRDRSAYDASSDVSSSVGPGRGL